jgi:DNA-binding response OmpR family regulator
MIEKTILIIDDQAPMVKILADIFKKTPIIVLTAKGGLNDIHTAFEAGANAFMPKPFSPGDVLLEVKKYLQ